MKFTETDLAFNQQGELSPAQYQYLIRDTVFSLALNLIGLTLVLLLLWTVWLLPIFIVILLLLARYALLITLDLRTGVVHSAEGDIQPTDLARLVTRTVTIGTENFRLPRPRTFPATGFCRVYYLPRTRKILALDLHSRYN